LLPHFQPRQGPRCFLVYQLHFRFNLNHTFPPRTPISPSSTTPIPSPIAIMAITDQIQIQFADLGLETRDQVYAPDADASGRDLNTTQAAQTAVASAAMQHRNTALNSGDTRAIDWNSEHLPSLHALKLHY
jgi:hypothetical protein